MLSNTLESDDNFIKNYSLVTLILHLKSNYYFRVHMILLIKNFHIHTQDNKNFTLYNYDNLKKKLQHNTTLSGVSISTLINKKENELVQDNKNIKMLQKMSLGYIISTYIYAFCNV